MARGAAVLAARPPKRDTLVSVCAKCSGDGPALRAALKREYKRTGLAKHVRVVKTSCLGLCPKRAVAVAVAGDQVASAGIRYFVVAHDANPAFVAARLRP